MAKTYDEMTLEELGAESGWRYERMQEIGLAISDDIDPAERLALELERAELRAHLNIIAPLRASKLHHEEQLRDPELHRMAGMSDDEFEAFLAERRKLRQAIKVAGGPEGAPEEPGVTTNTVVSQ